MFNPRQGHHSPQHPPVVRSVHSARTVNAPRAQQLPARCVCRAGAARRSPPPLLFSRSSKLDELVGQRPIAAVEQHLAHEAAATRCRRLPRCAAMASSAACGRRVRQASTTLARFLALLAPTRSASRSLPESATAPPAAAGRTAPAVRPAIPVRRSAGLRCARQCAPGAHRPPGRRGSPSWRIPPSSARVASSQGLSGATAAGSTPALRQRSSRRARYRRAARHGRRPRRRAACRTCCMARAAIAGAAAGSISSASVGRLGHARRRCAVRADRNRAGRRAWCRTGTCVWPFAASP